MCVFSRKLKTHKLQYRGIVLTFPATEESIWVEQNSRVALAIFKEEESRGREHMDKKMQSKGPRKQMKIKHSLTQILSPFDECYKKKSQAKQRQFPKEIYIWSTEKEK